MQENTTHTKDKVSFPLIVANITLLCFIISFSFMIYGTHHEQEALQTPPKTKNLQSFSHISVEAKSFVVWDISKQEVIFSKDEKTILPLASLTKIMTAVTALSILPKDTVVTIKKEFLAEEGDSGLYVDEKWNVKNLLDFSLMVSSNDGARSIASVAGAFASSTTNYSIGLKTFISQMNKTASKIGLQSLHFNNETGLDISSKESGGYGSALDVAKLMEYAIKNYPNMLEATKDSSEVIYSLDKKHSAQNTNGFVEKIPNLIASKTGYTELSGGNLGVVFDAGVGHPIAIVVLGSSYNGRFLDVTKLASSTLAYLRDNE